MVIGAFYSIYSALRGSFILKIPEFRRSREERAKKPRGTHRLRPFRLVVISAAIPLVNPKVFSLAAVSRFDKEKLLLNTQKLIAVSRAHRDSIEPIARIRVEQVITNNRPAAGKLRNEFFAVNHFPAKIAIAPKNVVATLNFVDVAPLPKQGTCSRRLQARTGRHQAT